MVMGRDVKFPLFRGANVTLGKVSKIGRLLTEFKADEIAYVVARFMWENGESHPNGMLYRGSISRVIRKIWDYESDDGIRSVQRAVGPMLRKNGFRQESYAYPGGNAYGWLAPFEFTWKDDDSVATKKEVKVEEPPAAEVKTMWGCLALTCDRTFDTKSKRDRHMKTAHKLGKKFGEGEGDRLTANHLLVLDEITKNPGLHPREYAKSLGISGTAMSGFASVLRHHGLVATQGMRASTKYFPVDVPPAQVKLLSVHPEYRELYRLLERKEGRLPRECAEILGIPAHKVYSAARALREAGLLVVNGGGGNQRYFLVREKKEEVQPEPVAKPEPGISIRSKSKKEEEPMESPAPMPTESVPLPMPSVSSPASVQTVQQTGVSVLETLNGRFAIIDGVMYKLIPVE